LQWTVVWSNGRVNEGINSFVGQDEADARAKYYSIDPGGNAVCLIHNNTIVLDNRQQFDYALEWDIGFAILISGTLPIPTSSSAYSVPSCCFTSSDHNCDNPTLYSTDDAIDAGSVFGTRDTQGCAALLLGGGSIIRSNRAAQDRCLMSAIGHYYMSVTGEAELKRG
jgi:hypothetical protein